MDNTIKKGRNLPSQGFGCPGAGECGGTVPASASSSSCEGLICACTAGAQMDRATAKARYFSKIARRFKERASKTAIDSDTEGSGEFYGSLDESLSFAPPEFVMNSGDEDTHMNISGFWEEDPEPGPSGVKPVVTSNVLLEPGSVKLVGRPDPVLVSGMSDVISLSDDSEIRRSQGATEDSPHYPVSEGSEGEVKQRLRLLSRARGRPRKDGSGPFRKDTAKSKRPRGNPPSQQEEAPEIGEPYGIWMPNFNTKQRRDADGLIKELTGLIGTSRIARKLDLLCQEVEDARARTTSMKGELSGRIKVNTWVISSLLKLLADRACRRNDPEALKTQAEAAEREMMHLNLKNAELKEKVRLLQMTISRANSDRKRRDPRPAPPPSAASPRGDEGGIRGPSFERVEALLRDLTLRLDALEKKLDDKYPERTRVDCVGRRWEVSPVRTQNPSPKIKGGKTGKSKGPGISGSAFRSVAVGGGGGREAGKSVPAPSDIPSYSSIAKRDKKKASGAPPVARSLATGGPKKDGADAKKRKEELRRAKRRVPKSAAVVLHCPEGEFAAAARRARSAINLEEIGIRDIRVRKALNGDLVIEIPGEEAETRAKILASRMEGVLRGTEAKVSCPTKTSEILLRGVDALVEADEVLSALREASGLPLEGLKLVPLRPPYGGLRTSGQDCRPRRPFYLSRRAKLGSGGQRRRWSSSRGVPPAATTAWGGDT